MSSILWGNAKFSWSAEGWVIRVKHFHQALAAHLWHERLFNELVGRDIRVRVEAAEPYSDGQTTGVRPGELRLVGPDLLDQDPEYLKRMIEAMADYATSDADQQMTQAAERQQAFIAAWRPRPT